MATARSGSDLGPFPTAIGYDKAIELDESDPLAGFRDRYVITDPDLIYLDGNSLGRLPKETAPIIGDVAERQWGDRLIRAWNEGWWDLHVRLGGMLAPLVGALPGEVIISDSTSGNLFKLAHAAVAARPGRHKIVTDDLNFPTDLYVLDGVARLFGGKHRVEIVASDGVHGPVEALQQSIDRDTALVSLSHTTFKSGYTYDLAAVTARAHEVGALVLWDCSHSVGALPIDFENSGVDLAVGCTYKYLNGGPGSPAFLYVRSVLQDELINPVTGWWGHEDPFAFDLDFRPVAGIRRFHTGTMPILSLAAIEPGISDVASAGIEAIRSKSIRMSSFLVELWEAELEPLGFELRSPLDGSARGAHISLGHKEARLITQAMIERAGVIPDFRTPDNVRFGLPPLYTSFLEIHTAAIRIKRLVTDGVHQEFGDFQVPVT
jgi:kynureninase